MRQLAADLNGEMTRLAHFALNADDLDTARDFYEAVFGWTFSAYGPPGFYQLAGGAPDGSGVIGALQQRRELEPGIRLTGPECTFAVNDVDVVAAKVTAAGGRILMEKATLPGVGHLIFFLDVAGNTIGAMQYDSSAS